MGYAERISELIEQSGMQLIEISARCKMYGVNVTSSYLSKLKGGKMPPPSENINIALAKVLEVNEDELIWEAFIDRAPDRFKEELVAFRHAWPDIRDSMLSYIEKIGLSSLADEVRSLPLEKQAKAIRAVVSDVKFAPDGSVDTIKIDVRKK
ncbi:hypothetical protein H1S01_03045 [Heliobacterium chlorum]|uniref:HTH cro/C1-type domain-containing protein n=1 Tax=Heliobacterium chlorum TaxID=2698 RepID=A0ABR7T064_HELCL|nr:helix-turn-helix transcriptional regulator [Heliobacterium chlorum]MBC9783487.1 hypothetical protein [Heliobacterium chlorum]